MQQTVVPVNAGSKVTIDYGYLSVVVETEGKGYRLEFPQTAEDLVLACDTLIDAIQKVRLMAPASVR